MADKRFTLTEEHLKLLRHAHVTWNDCEFGAPAIDCKRPYGNSSVILDIAEILGLEPFVDHEGEKHYSTEHVTHCTRIHSGTQDALRIVIQMGVLSTGTYEHDSQLNWKRIGD